jgi:hypothetical protein
MRTYCLQVPQLLPEVLVRDLFKSFRTLNDSLVGNSNEEVDPKAGQKAKTGKVNIKLTCQEPDYSLVGYKSVWFSRKVPTSIVEDVVPPFQQR